MPTERADNRLLETSESVTMKYSTRRATNYKNLLERFEKYERCWGFLRLKNLQKIRNRKHFETKIGVLSTYKNTLTFLRTIRNTSWLVLAISRNDNFSNNSPTLRRFEFIINNSWTDSFPERCSLRRLFLTVSVGATSAAVRVASSLKTIREHRRVALKVKTLNQYSKHYTSKDRLQIELI